MNQPTRKDKAEQPIRAEYTARIHRVFDYIDRHLAEPLRVETLARVAHLSPFYFHRVFTAMTGETVSRLIQRLRLEKAALQLRAHPSKPITNIAMDCGFSGSSAFSRAFREAFGTTPSEWRSSPALDRKLRTTDRNLDQPPSKAEQESTSSSWQIDVASGHLTWRMKMNNKTSAQIEVKELPTMEVAYVRHTGPYQGNPEVFKDLFERLCTWAGARGLMGRPGLNLLAVYHDDPAVTDEAKRRVSACLPVPEGTAVDGEVGKMSIAGGKFAVGRFELGPQEYEQAWKLIFGQWLPQSGFQPDDRLCYESFPLDAKGCSEGKHVVDICVPVKPL